MFLSQAYSHVVCTAGEVTKAIMKKGGKAIAEECKRLGRLITKTLRGDPPTRFPQILIIETMTIVWRVRGKNYQVCCIQYCVQQLCTVQCTDI